MSIKEFIPKFLNGEITIDSYIHENNLSEKQISDLHYAIMEHSLEFALRFTNYQKNSDYMNGKLMVFLVKNSDFLNPKD